MKKLKNLIKVLAIVATMILCIGTSSQAVEISEQEPIKVAALSDIIRAGNAFTRQGSASHNENEEVNRFAEMLAPIGSILAGVGLVIFLAVLAIMGIKWVVAKPDQKAKLQQQFVGYVIAAVVFFGAVGIWNIVRNIMQNVERNIG